MNKIAMFDLQYELVDCCPTVSDGNSRFSEGIFVHGQAHVQIGPFELIFGGVPVLG